MVALAGGPQQTAAAVAKFTADAGAAFVLLCSLEHRAAGLNLQAANHVVRDLLSSVALRFSGQVSNMQQVPIPFVPLNGILVIIV